MHVHVMIYKTDSISVLFSGWPPQCDANTTLGDEHILDQISSFMMENLELDVSDESHYSMGAPCIPAGEAFPYAVNSEEDRDPTRPINKVMMHRDAFAETKCFNALCELPMWTKQTWPTTSLDSYCFAGKYSSRGNGVSFNGPLSNVFHPVCNSGGFAMSLCQGEMALSTQKDACGIVHDEVTIPPDPKMIWKGLLWKLPGATSIPFSEDEWEPKKLKQKGCVFEAFLNKTRALYLVLNPSSVPSLIILEDNSYEKNEGIAIKLSRKAVEEEWKLWGCVSIDNDQELSSTVSRKRKK